MSNLKKMMEQYCPNGTEYKRLGDICEIKTGSCLTKKDVEVDGKYFIISGGVSPLGVCNQYNREGNTVTVSRAGSAGFVNFIETKFWLNDKCFSVIPISEDITPKFLYYALKDKEKEIMEMKSTGSIPTINTQKLSMVEVPVLPNVVQLEIVRILDKFTELQAELQSELQAREKEYEYFRNKLLDVPRISFL